MNYTELISLLKPYAAVLVTGPQRSGTTLGAHILAQELGYRYCDEDEFRIHDHNRAYDLMKRGNVVLQAPALMHTADRFSKRLNYAVVVMRRYVPDIWRSESRINWRTAYNGANLMAEQRKYWERFRTFSDDIANLKYMCWDTMQKQNCVNFDLEYDSLKTHPLWQAEHADFAPRQWENQDGRHGSALKHGGGMYDRKLGQ